MHYIENIKHMNDETKLAFAYIVTGMILGVLLSGFVNSLLYYGVYQ